MKTRFEINEIYPNLTRVETTVGINGYPSHLQYAYHCDSRKEMKEIIEDLRQHGHEVDELFLRKRNGQQLWSRELRDHFSIDLTLSNERDYTWSFNMDESEDVIKEDIKEMLYSGDEDIIEEKGYELVEKEINDFYSEISHRKGEGPIIVFYDPSNGNWVDYIITEDCTGYHDGDVTSYQMAFTVYEKDEDDEEE